MQAAYDYPNYTTYARPCPPRRQQVLINGDGGPYNECRYTGAYGRNTHGFVQQYLSQGGNINDAVVQYSQRDPRYGFHGLNQLYNDATGYAHEAVKKADCNGDLAIDENELTQEYGGDCQKAKHALRVLDRNQDGKIDVAERAAATLLMDADQDGQITAEERAAFDNRLQCDPRDLAGNLGDLLCNGRADLAGRARQIACEGDVPPQNGCNPQPSQPGCGNNGGWGGNQGFDLSRLFQMLIQFMFGGFGGGYQHQGGYGGGYQHQGGYGGGGYYR